MYQMPPPPRDPQQTTEHNPQAFRPADGVGDDADAEGERDYEVG